MNPFPAALSGFLLGASLIIATGAQNAFILRHGLLRRHVFVLCLICAASDAVLIALGVVVAFPYLPASGSPAFAGVSVFMGVLFSLASSSSLSSTRAPLPAVSLR